ncbi:hypothetical protein EDC04DRAFT_1035150 [Pisolithus marmoratus]|nr:hypothetical protein EDC04DRAFT_1035150 [Pisolithus marmoratus]
MDRELAQLRDELDRLHKRECELQRELFDVRAAAEIKRKQIEDISKMRAVAAINRLPVEVFTRILHFALSMPCYSRWHEYGTHKLIYARVSRWWRDVILNSPSLWATICVSPHWASSFVEMHVARSGEHPLDIAVLQRWHGDNDVSFLGPILSCTRRWRSLTIRAGAALT